MMPHIDRMKDQKIHLQLKGDALVAQMQSNKMPLDLIRSTTSLIDLAVENETTAIKHYDAQSASLLAANDRLAVAKRLAEALFEEDPSRAHAELLDLMCFGTGEPY